MRSLPTEVITGLADAGLTVTTDPDVLAGHQVDWTGRWTGTALGLARPRDAHEVASILAICRESGTPVHVQGGNTGLVGGAVPDRPSLILSTTAMTSMDPVDPLERTVVVGAGVTGAAVGAKASDAGLHFGVDLASRDSATVGGMVATNAGGLAVVAHGQMRDQVRGLRAVLADGTIIDSIGRPRKDNAGFDFWRILIGAEGVLGIVTDVEIGLRPKPMRTTTALAAMPDLAAVVLACREVQAAGWQLLAAEVIDAAGIARAATMLDTQDPLAASGGGHTAEQSRWALLVDVADDGTAEGVMPIGDQVVAVATEGADRSRLWALRNSQSQAYAQLPAGTLVKLDVSVPLHRMDELVDRAQRLSQGSVGFFGHALDGNVHIQLTSVDPQAEVAILKEVVDLGGSISAEHGIGRHKAASLGLVRSAAEVRLMRAVKAMLDPTGMLNHGVLLSADGRDRES